MKFQFNIHKTKTYFSKQFKRVISKGGFSIARLIGIVDKPKVRVPGSAAGQIKISTDFDAPLPEDVLRDFEG